MNNKNKYPNEMSFSRHFCAYLKKYGCFIQRIESGLTGKGIPDIFAVVSGVPMWIELKRVKKNIESKNLIPWRPGQRAWLRQVGQHMMCYTIVMFDDCIGVITHGYYPTRPLDYPNNRVSREKMYETTSMGNVMRYVTYGMTPGPIDVIK